MHRIDAISLMNRLGHEKTPFLFVIDYLAQNAMVFPLNEVKAQNIRYNLNGISNAASEMRASGKRVDFSKQPITFDQFFEKYKVVMGHLKKGNSYLTNLTCQTPVETNLSLAEIFELSQAPYKLWFEGKFVVFSPETFVQIRQNKIYSFPMKGTINASIPNAREVILNDYKESAEHATITDLIRNDLGMVAQNIKVEKYRYIDILKTNQGELLQVSSIVSGELDPDWQSRLGDLFFKLLPAGSICGAPKPKTLEIIKEAECYNRGFYTGVFGIFNGSEVDSGVMIRFIEETPNGKVFKSGGGITVNSKAEDEYREMVDKVYLPFI